jgi:hypothetical protein
MRGAISLAWSLFARKVGGDLIRINKEASMQLQLGYILQQVLPLIIFRKGEEVQLELETGAKIGSSSCEIDLLLTGQTEQRKYRFAVELKCYRTKASSGGLRGATDIFMKDVYEDLMLLERYIESDQAEAGIALVMTDLERLVRPKKKDAKCWDYDISHGATFGPVTLATPIGGKPISIQLKRQYELRWVQYGSFWFLEVEGMAEQLDGL